MGLPNGYKLIRPKFKHCSYYMIADYNQGLSIARISKKYNVSCETIRTYFITLGVAIRSRSESRKLPWNIKRNDQIHKIEIPKSSELLIVDLYNKGHGVPYIRKHVRVCTNHVLAILKKNNIHIRSQLESRMIAKHLAYRVEEVVVDGKTFKCQGHENIAIRELVDSGIKVDDILLNESGIPTIHYIFNGKCLKYYPDIFIPKLYKIIEVKSEYTFMREFEKNLAKKNQSIKNGFAFEFWVYNRKLEKRVI